MGFKALPILALLFLSSSTPFSFKDVNSFTRTYGQRVNDGSLHSFVCVRGDGIKIGYIGKNNWAG